MPAMERTNIQRKRSSIFTRSARKEGRLPDCMSPLSAIFYLAVPREFENLGVEVSHKIDNVLPNADVVNLLRIQHERQRKEYFPGIGEYTRFFGLTKERAKLLKPDCLIMHPGPINRGVEIDSEVADGLQSVILDQVTNGLAVRMAVLYLCGGIAT